MYVTCSKQLTDFFYYECNESSSRIEALCDLHSLHSSRYRDKIVKEIFVKLRNLGNKCVPQVL